MTSKEALDYIIKSERWGEPTCVEEATKNHEIEKWLRKQIEINEILKERATLEHDAINENYKWITINMSNQDARFNKLEEWLNEI